MLAHLQTVSDCVLRHEEYFRKIICEQRRIRSEAEIKTLRSKLERNEKRIAELKRLFMKIYEDSAAGRLSDERYEMLSTSYESEQKQLENEAATLRESIRGQEKQNESVEQFIEKMKKHAMKIGKLDGYVLHELIEGIYVEAPDRSSGHRTQAIHIKYNGIGFIPINKLIAKQTA